MANSFLLCVAGRALSQSPTMCHIATGTQTSMMGTARSLCARKGLNENIWRYIRHMLRPLLGRHWQVFIPYLVWASCADGHGERAGWLFVSCL
ncbi:hypothetical protein B0H13DRAFT_2001159 [Mycena leptocephala]|nr:hypothetical protein B0H13DRAFT_2039238 [Mycena leptocephala]KAJ7914970.1 hypothetical protein B0H13DRAFT_2001159 [Mycena leptocephala]